MSANDNRIQQVTTLADQLRDKNDRAIWTRVETDVLPRVLAALRRQFPSSGHWLDLEGAVRSAERTAMRRLDDGSDPKLETLETFESLLRWLIGTARNKFLEQLRRARVEQKHAPHIGQRLDQRARDLLDGLAHKTAEQVVQQLRQSLDEPIDLAIFEGKLAEKNEVLIANELSCSTRKVRGRWKRIRDNLCKGEANDFRERPTGSSAGTARET
jgi:DNA-directed RNA polymerase specialized sigma24 family protein